MGGMTRPVRTPSTISSSLAWNSSMPRRCCRERGEEVEAAGEDGGAVAEELEGAHEALGPVGQGDGVEQTESPLGGEAFEQAETAGEALVELQLAAHGGFGDFGDLVADAGHFGQLVDDLALDEGRVHVEDEEAAVAAEDAFALEGDVEGEVLRGGEELGAHGGLIGRGAADGKLDTSIGRQVAGGEAA